MDIGQFKSIGYAVVKNAVPPSLCEALVLAIAQTFGLDADNPETWYRDPPYPWDVVGMWGYQAQWDIRQYPSLHQVWSDLWGTHRLLVSLDRCRFTPPWREGQYPELPIHWDHNPHDPNLRYIQVFCDKKFRPDRAVID